MAPTFKHGKDGQFYFNQYDFSGWFSEATISHSVDAAEVTAFKAADKGYIPGLRDATASFSGHYDGSTGDGPEERMHQAIGSTRNDIVTFALEGSTVGGNVRMFEAVKTSFEISAPVSDKISANVAFQMTGRAEGGKILQSAEDAQTSTGSESSIDSGIAAGTSFGGVGHFQMVAASTLNTFAAKVQHSTNGSAWTDLITFANTTAVSSTSAAQRVQLGSTVLVKRYVRANRATFTGGASKSVTAGVAFARRFSK